jgi:hypothetical protein
MGGYCHELFLRSKRFLAKRVTPIKGKKPRTSRKIIPDFYRMHFLPAYEPKNPRVANKFPPEEREPNHPKEAYYLPPMSQTHLPVCEAATNWPFFSLGNPLHGSSRVRFEGAMAFPKQRPQPPASMIIGSTHIPLYVTSTNSPMLSLEDRVRESRTLQVQQGDPSRHVWARQNPSSPQANLFVGLIGKKANARAAVCTSLF